MNPKLIFTGLLCLLAIGRAAAQFSPLAPMPERVSNNAVVAAQVAGKTFVYSFCGIDSTKVWSGIHLKAWRLDLEANEWQPLPDVPDPNGGKISAAASFLKGKIYVVGGYHVAQNGSETSSVKTHVFDPATNTWLPDAAPIPVAIDDQVQAVWQDSLLYVVTGWSNTTNVPQVQVFDPSENKWSAATPVPNEHDYKVFGGAGVFIGDTLYYAGGARATNNFPPTSVFRKGVVNPNHPLEIAWSKQQQPESKGYRMAAATHQGKAVWLGGSDVTYNYNGIAYNGSGGVPALDRTTVFDPASGNFFQVSGNMPPVMDLRGAAQCTDDEVVLAGGMTGAQEVSNLVWRIRLDDVTGVETGATPSDFYKVFPNPASKELTIELPGPFELEMHDAAGSFLFYKQATDQAVFSIANLAPGVYWLDLSNEKGRRASEKVIVQ